MQRLVESSDEARKKATEAAPIDLAGKAGVQDADKDGFANKDEFWRDQRMLAGDKIPRPAPEAVPMRPAPVTNQPPPAAPVSATPAPATKANGRKPSPRPVAQIAEQQQAAASKQKSGALAQNPVAESTNAGDLGVTMSTEHISRGLVVENPGVVAQPFLDSSRQRSELEERTKPDARPTQNIELPLMDKEDEAAAKIVGQNVANPPSQVQVESKFTENTQNNLKELNFDWLLGQANLPGNKSVFSSDGTQGSAPTPTLPKDAKERVVGMAKLEKKLEEAPQLAEQDLKQAERAKMQLAMLKKQNEQTAAEVAELRRKLSAVEAEKNKDAEAKRQQPQAPPPVPQPEVATSANAFSTFSLNVSDVAFKLAAASLEKGQMPEPSTVRSEEFINAFDYRDPEPAAGVPLAFATERARYPFAQNRDLLRFSVKTAAEGRQAGRPLNLVLLIDSSGSMERADRVHILQEALRVLCTQLHKQDKLSVVTFARTPRLWADGVAGDKAAEVTQRITEVTPQGGTNIAAALDLGYATALRHYQVGSINRVVLLTDGAANLGDVNPEELKKKVEENRRQGVALDCFGIGWEDYDDTVLEALSRNGDGRYGFLNSPEEASTEFAGQLAGALHVAASDVKVQIEFNPRRVTAYRQIGYAKHQLKKEQFRDNTVDAAEIGAAESGNALYVVEVNPAGEGDLAMVRVRSKVPGTNDYREHEWPVPYNGAAIPLEQASPTLRLAGAASAFSEWLVASPYATEVTPDRLLGLLNGCSANFGADPRPKKLEWMIRAAKSVSGR